MSLGIQRATLSQKAWYSAPKVALIVGSSYANLHLREFFEDFRKKFDSIAVKAGMSVDHYRQWLGHNGQADSISSRHRYLIDLDGARVV